MTLSPSVLIGLLAAIICLLVLAVYFAAGTKRRLDTIARQQREMMALMASALERRRDIEPEQPRSIRSRAEPRLAEEEEGVERPGRARPAGDLVARR